MLRTAARCGLRAPASLSGVSSVQASLSALVARPAARPLGARAGHQQTPQQHDQTAAARRCFAHATIHTPQRHFATSSSSAASSSSSASAAAAAASASAPAPPSGIIYTQKIPKKKSSFRDRVRLHVSGGRGGNGCSSYDTDPYGKGGPDGANGGRGGDVYLVSTDQLAGFGLDSFHLKGQSGHAGGSQLSKGRNGYSLKVPIPAGTVVSEILATDPAEGAYTLKLLADMDRSGLEIKVATGGEGGLGNRAFTTKYRKQARFSTIGMHGSTKWLLLELKCIADVGLVGYPNAGKSSFLAAISNATPEIANYPFTTLHPQVGIVETEDVAPQAEADPAPADAAADAVTSDHGASTSASPASTKPSSSSSTTSSSPAASFSADPASSMSRLSVADLPGLISGAATENRGLGHEFLKHIQRTKVLCYVVDVSGNDDRDPVQDFLSLQQELQFFDPNLLRRPAILLANKVDNTEKHRRAWMRTKVAELRTVTDLEIFETSCLQRTGLQPVVRRLAQLVTAQAATERRERQERMRAEVVKERDVQRELEQRERERAAEEEKAATSHATPAESTAASDEGVGAAASTKTKATTKPKRSIAPEKKLKKAK